MFKAFLIVLSFIGVAFWSYTAGTLEPQVTYTEVLPDLYSDYLIFEMEEDGSYSAVTIAGMEVTGCIENALCNKAIKY